MLINNIGNVFVFINRITILKKIVIVVNNNNNIYDDKIYLTTFL